MRLIQGARICSALSAKRLISTAPIREWVLSPLSVAVVTLHNISYFPTEPMNKHRK